MSSSEYSKIFSKKLNYYMEINGKKQSDIISDLGINKSAISTWMNGTRMPRMDKVQLLADYFGINKSDLLEEKPYVSDDETEELAKFLFENPDYKSLFDSLKNISADDFELIRTFINRIIKKD